MAELIGSLWSVEWGNPYTDPPADVETIEGMPGILYGVCVIGEDRTMPQQIFDLVAQLGLGSGWSSYWSPIKPEPRVLSEASKQSARRKKLMTKLKKKAPLFAEQFYEDALREKPDYYGVDPETLEVV